MVDTPIFSSRCLSVYFKISEEGGLPGTERYSPATEGACRSVQKPCMQLAFSADRMLWTRHEDEQLRTAVHLHPLTYCSTEFTTRLLVLCMPYSSRCGTDNFLSFLKNIGIDHASERLAIIEGGATCVLLFCVLVGNLIAVFASNSEYLSLAVAGQGRKSWVRS